MRFEFYADGTQWNGRVVFSSVPLYAANANTSGATLAQLETEVNELKGTLRSLGVLAP
jgi:hypothetical protein